MQDLQGCRSTGLVTLADGRKMRVDRTSDFWLHASATIRRVVPAGSMTTADGTTFFFLRAGSDAVKRGYSDWYDLTPQATANPLTDEIDPMPMDQRIAQCIDLHAQIIAKFEAAMPLVYDCAGRRDGCHNRVSVAGTYCRRCAHDEE